MPEAPTLRLECSEAGASKFWQIHQLEGEVTINWGRIGTAGQTQIKQFTSAAEAEAFRDTQAAAKRKKGYIDATGQQVTFPIGEPAPRSKKAANSKKVQPQDPKAPPSPKTISSAAEGKVLWSARQRATRLRFVNDDIGFSSDKTSEIYRHFRDMPFLPPPADAAAARAILRPRLRLALLELKNSFPPELAEALSGLRHLALPDRPTEALSLEAAAVGLSLMPTYDQSLMDWLILAQGPSFAVEALLASLHYPTEHRYSGARISYAAEASAFYLYRIGFACLTLHRWLREIPCEDAAYRQAWERAGELRPELGGIGRVLLAFLFSRETDGLEAAVREWLDLDINGLPTYRTVPGGGAMNMIMTGTVGHWNSGWLLWPLVAKAELQAGFSARWLKESEHEQNIILDFLCEWSGWALECLGEAAAGLLAFLTAHGRKSEQRKAGAELLALIHSPRAHAEMARLLTTREGQKYFPEPLRRTPAWSIPALLAAVLAQPRQAEPRRQLEHLLALAEPELLAGLSLSPDQAALLASLQSA
ncbi:MAG: WGR domain-containing protein, partial [Candidatus Sericytochromatia bacterium]